MIKRSFASSVLALLGRFPRPTPGEHVPDSTHNTLSGTTRDEQPGTNNQKPRTSDLLPLHHIFIVALGSA